MYNNIQYGQLTLSHTNTNFDFYFAVSKVVLTLGQDVKQELDFVVIKMTGDLTFKYIDYSQTVTSISLKKLIIVVVSCTILFLIFVAYRL